MSARGVKGAAVARGGTDGSDFKDRQVLAPRYELMAGYRRELGQLFTYLPYFYLGAIIVTAIHFQAAGLKAISQSFLPGGLGFWFQLVGLVISAVINLSSIYSQSNLPLIVLSSLTTLAIIYLGILYTLQSLSIGGFVWVSGAILNSLIVLLNARGIYSGYMITQLQGSKKQ